MKLFADNEGCIFSVCLSMGHTFLFIIAGGHKRESEIAMKKVLCFLIILIGILNTTACTSDNPHTETNDDSSSDNNQSEVAENQPNSDETSNDDNYNSLQITKISPSNYDGPECWLLFKSKKVIEVYADINTTDTNWKESCKTVFTMLVDEMNISTDYSNSENIIIKLYNRKDLISYNQPTYADLIALWETRPVLYIPASSPRVIFYPNGAVIAAKQETENWQP